MDDLLREFSDAVEAKNWGKVYKAILKIQREAHKRGKGGSDGGWDLLHRMILAYMFEGSE